MGKIRSVMKLALSFLVAAALVPSMTLANTFTGQDVPSNLLVVRGDTEWAWAAPCPPDGSECANGVVLQLHHGFQLATMSDWTTYFADRDDVYNAFHPGGNQLCASPYFNVYGDNCDSGDLSIGAVWNFPQDPAWDQNGFNNTNNLESFVLRQRVPEPTTVLLLGAGLAALSLRRRQS